MKPWISKHEQLFLGFIIAFYLCINLLTASRSPTVWQDEIMFADPAVNLVVHGTWTSTAWSTQSASEFWIGNAPLYPALLAAWLKIFGTGITAVRSLNFLLTALSALVLWHWSVRTQVVARSWARLVLVTLALTGHGIAFSYRSGRYDALGYLLCCIGLWAFSLSDRKLRRTILAITGFLLPWTGLQLLPYAGILGLVCLAVFRGRCFADWFCAGLGSLAGLGILGTTLGMSGLWQPFVESVIGLSGSGNSLFGKLATVGSVYFQDPSWLLLVFLVVILFFFQSFRTARPHSLEIVLATAAIALISPAALHLSGKFPPYYTWMSYLPTAILVAHLLSILDLHSPLRRTAVALGLGAAILIGLPARLAVTALQWRERSYEGVARLVEANLKPGETAYCHYQAYYAAKPIARIVYLPPYERIMSAKERDSLQVLITTADDENLKRGNLGEGWVEVIQENPTKGATPPRFLGISTAQLYSLRVFRKTAS